MKAGKRTWCIVSLILALSTIVSGVILRFCAEYHDRDFLGNDFPIYTAIITYVAFAYITLLALSQYGLLIPLFIRFYKHLYTDEGYLTFTLPAKRSQILLSKTLSTGIYTALYFVVILLCSAFLALIIPPAEYAEQVINPVVYKGLWDMLKVVFEEGYGGWFIAFTVEAILLFAAVWSFNIVLVQFCITMGSIIAKKHKLLASVGIFFGTNVALSVFSRILSLCIQILSYGGNLDFLMNLSETQGLWAAALTLLGVVAAFATIGLAFYCTTLNLLERKLNLA